MASILGCVPACKCVYVYVCVCVCECVCVCVGKRGCVLVCGAHPHSFLLGVGMHDAGAVLLRLTLQIQVQAPFNHVIGSVWHLGMDKSQEQLQRANSFAPVGVCMQKLCTHTDLALHCR